MGMTIQSNSELELEISTRSTLELTAATKKVIHVQKNVQALALAMNTACLQFILKRALERDGSEIIILPLDKCRDLVSSMDNEIQKQLYFLMTSKEI